MKIFKIFSLFIIFCFSTGLVNGQAEITLEKLWKDYEYFPNRVPGFKFMEDGKHYTRLEKNVIKRYDLTTGSFVENILDGSDLKDQEGFTGKISSYSFNPNESIIIIESEKEGIYRRSSKANFYIYNRKNNKLKSVFDDGKISYGTLSPDGTKLAYVFENNLYYVNLLTSKTYPITTDGEVNKIINGAADWVYEEEFSFAKAFFWSADSKKIAYQRFDETQVPEFTMTNYTNELYPEYQTFKYPKVGQKNAEVTVHIYNLESRSTIDVDLDDKVEHYIPRLKWTKDGNKLLVYKMNRHQNHLEVIGVNARNGKTNLIFEEKNDYYIDITDDIRFLENGKEFIWTSEKSGYNHIYLYDINGAEKRALTSGNYDVTNFYGVDEKNGKVFYQAAEKSPLEKKIFSVGLNGKGKKLMTNYAGTSSAQFSKTFDYYVNTTSAINIPPTYTVYNRKNEVVREIEKNLDLRKVQEETDVNPIDFFTFKTSDDFILNGWILKPDNFKEDGQYPVFMYLYGGPGSQQVTNSWKGQNYWWFQMLAKQGFVVACVDNRGTGARGEEFKKTTYQQLGHYETIDQIEAAKYLGSLPFTDKERIGIFGWSYGGYMSSLCLLKGNDVFKAAIAVAPVTNWKWYDTIYTERYMRTEEENPTGYSENSPVNFADQLRGNYLLVHGGSDDNVHFQNTAEMANALIKENKQFDTYFYPNRAHGISGNNARLHLYTKMTNFLNDKLKNGVLENDKENNQVSRP